MSECRKQITCKVYGTLYTKFKDICTTKYSSTVNERMTYLIQCYLNGKITLEDIQEKFSLEKRKFAEHKDMNITLRIDKTLYENLSEDLKKVGMRPATWVSLAMGYFVATNDYSLVMKREQFVHDATVLLNSNPNISHVVYGLKYYRLQAEQQCWKLVHEENFLDPCTEERYQEIYANHTPIYEVLAVHK